MVNLIGKSQCIHILIVIKQEGEPVGFCEGIAVGFNVGFLLGLAVGIITAWKTMQRYWELLTGELKSSNSFHGIKLMIDNIYFWWHETSLRDARINFFYVIWLSKGTTSFSGSKTERWDIHNDKNILKTLAKTWWLVTILRRIKLPFLGPKVAFRQKHYEHFGDVSQT